MISYEIVREKPPEPERRPINLDTVRRSLPPWAPSPAASAGVGRGKHQYAIWVKEVIEPMFPKGRKVTHSGRPYLPGHLPDIVWTVGEIQQIHYLAEVDKTTGEQKCIGVRTSDSHDIPVYYPPSLLRPLEPEEEKLYDLLRNQKGAVRRVATVDVDGTPVIVDGDTGVIIQREE